MANDKDLIIKQAKVTFNPERDTAKAARAARQLIDIVKQNGWSISLGGKKEHIFYEGWQTVGKYYNYTVATGEAVNVEIGEVTGFKAKAWVVDNRTGMKVGEAEAYCMKDEANWKTKPLFQLASMAQTRAGSKALRQIFGFVVALAGYSPTPAEEMIKDNDPAWIKNPTITTNINGKCEDCQTTNKYHKKGCAFELGTPVTEDVKAPPTCHIHNIQLLRGISKTKVDKDGNPKKYWYHPAENGGICFGNDTSDFKKDMEEQKIPERDINEKDLVDDADKALS